MIRALFIDLDGTLLDSQRRVTPVTVETLSACRDRGIRLFAATARAPLIERMLPQCAMALTLFDGGVYANGACIRAGELDAYALLPGESAAACLDVLTEYPGCNLALQLRAERHAFRCPLENASLAAWGLAPEDIVPLQKANLDEVVRVLVFYGDLVAPAQALPQALVDALAAAAQGRAEMTLTDGGLGAQVMRLGVSKAVGVERVRRYFGWRADETAVFGDDTPDIPMLAA